MDNNRYLTIDGIPVEINGEKNLLALIQKVGIKMPTFCYHSELSTYGACRMCMVEDQWGTLHASCSTPPKPGMEIRTNTERLRKYRKVILELLLANHCRDCTTCDNNEKCKLQDIARRFHIEGVRFPNAASKPDVDDSSPCITIDHHKCILCGDCVRTCNEIQNVGVIDFMNRGSRMVVGTAFHKPIGETDCVGCGQCSAVCPTGAIVVKNNISDVWKALSDKDTMVTIQIAPAVRVAVGEAFGFSAGENVLDKLVTALKLMGVDEVYDTTFGADFTTIAESEEFLERLKNGGPFPMFTSCCPAWVKYLENENPKYLKNISTCKSPMEMVGAIFRDKYAAKDAADGRTTYHIAIMPCTAKKMEAARPEFIHDGRPDVDLVLTTREVIDMMQETGIQLGELELESPDLPFGLGSGAAVIYGTSGGVAEAVVRHCLPDKSKNALREISILGLRGDAPIKEASVTIGDTELKLAVVNGLANAKKLLKEIDEGKKFYHLIEVMTCQGGCVGGAGQPYGLKKSKEKRGDGLHLSDNAAMFKRAERNPVVAQMMAEYGEERCHELLHVSYTSK